MVTFSLPTVVADKIDREELREILKSTDMYGCEVHLDDDYIDDTLRLGDKNGDGMLDIDGKTMAWTEVLAGFLAHVKWILRFKSVKQRMPKIKEQNM